MHGKLPFLRDEKLFCRVPGYRVLVEGCIVITVRRKRTERERERERESDGRGKRGEKRIPKGKAVRS